MISLKTSAKLDKLQSICAAHQRCYEQPNINITMNGALAYPIDPEIIRKATESILISIR